MGRHEEWQGVLDAQVRRWSAMSCEDLLSKLRGVQAFEIVVNSKTYQVEVELLENTDRFLQVMVAVDDGSMPASISPVTKTFIRNK
jgi:hypothetical protein